MLRFFTILRKKLLKTSAVPFSVFTISPFSIKRILHLALIFSDNEGFDSLLKRICIITAKTSDNIKCHLISAYAPTFESTMRNPDETRIFYEQLLSLKNSIKKRHVLIIGGDFNAKINL